jgi:hypothetical protein
MASVKLRVNLTLQALKAALVENACGMCDRRLYYRYLHECFMRWPSGSRISGICLIMIDMDFSRR